MPGLDHERVARTVATALSGPGGVALVVNVFAGLPGVSHTPAQRRIFRSVPESIQIADWRYDVASDGRLRAAHVVHGVVLAEETLNAGAVGPHIARALAQIAAQFGESVVPSIDAAVDALASSAGQ
jgi:hypothetical protein